MGRLGDAIGRSQLRAWRTGTKSLETPAEGQSLNP